MYAQTSLVTSVRGAVFLPHTAASASLSFFGAKMPSAFFFIVTVALAVVFAAVFVVVVVIAIEG